MSTNDQTGGNQGGAKPPVPPATPPPPVPTPAPEGDTSRTAIRPGMNETEIRAAGLTVDVPHETGTGKDRLKYADLGAGKKWTPPAGWPDSAEPVATTTPENLDSEGGDQPDDTPPGPGKEKPK